jgi:uncharacterized protein (DUF2384 family)
MLPSQIGRRIMSKPGELRAIRPVAKAGGKRSVDFIAVKVARVRDVFGSDARLAQYLDVARSQPGRWIRGTERPHPGAARRIKDFEYVWDRASDEMDPQDARIWLESANPHLGGATPLMVLDTRGPAEVIAALDAEAAGSYG